VLDLLHYMAGWADGWAADRDAPISVQFTMGPADRDKRSAWIATESPTALGHLTIWETGEVEAEVVESESMRRVYVVSAVVKDAEALSMRLRAFVDACRAV